MMTFSASMIKKLPDFTIDLSFGCNDVEILAITGASGAGKTTIIRLLAGLERPDAGWISHRGNKWFDTGKNIFLPPQKRRVGYVFQEYSLFPHLNIERNVAFAAKDPSQTDRLLSLFDIRRLKKRRPHQVSGGERQRVALAQTLASEPEVLLLDEPFSSLDQMTRRKLRGELLKIKENFRLPIIQVTHDPDDVACLADQTLLIERGRLAGQWRPRPEVDDDLGGWKENIISSFQRPAQKVRRTCVFSGKGPVLT